MPFLVFFKVDWTFTENGLYVLKNGVFHDKTVVKFFILFVKFFLESEGQIGKRKYQEIRESMS